MDLDQIDIYLKNINTHLETVLMPSTNISGNITISLTFRSDGTVQPQFSVIGEIVPLEAINIIKDTITTLLDSATNVGVTKN